VMNPYPFCSLNHFTVPLAKTVLLGIAKRLATGRPAMRSF
jgi:hypothetical protein